MSPNEENLEQVTNYSLIEITEILIKHQNLHEGLYNLSVEFQLAVGVVGPSPETICPGAIVGISRIGISKTEASKRNHLTVDAAEVNPKQKRKKSQTTSSK